MLKDGTSHTQIWKMLTLCLARRPIPFQKKLETRTHLHASIPLKQENTLGTTTRVNSQFRNLLCRNSHLSRLEGPCELKLFGHRLLLSRCEIFTMSATITTTLRDEKSSLMTTGFVQQAEGTGRHVGHDSVREQTSSNSGEG